MFSLSNLEEQTTNVIYNRGKEYFDNGAVAVLEEIEDDLWQAEVDGTDIYEVSIVLDKKQNVKEYFCDCPYEGDLCKHVVASLLALREMLTIAIKPSETKKLNFNQFLKKITNDELIAFVKNYAAKNKGFKTDFEFAFAEKDENFDFIGRYEELIKKAIKKHTSRGFIEYRSSIALAKELTVTLEKIQELVLNGNLHDAFQITIILLKSSLIALTDADDSNGSIGGIVEDCILTIDQIVQKSPIDLQEQVFTFLSTELKNSKYFDYGDFGETMFDIYYQLTLKLSKSKEFLVFIDAKISKHDSRYNEYSNKFFVLRKISFLKEIGQIEEVKLLTQKNIATVEIRQAEIDRLIKLKDYNQAKNLVDDGIKIAKAKSHAGTENSWLFQLLRIAVLQNDIVSVKKFTKFFAFNNGFDKIYYRKWRATFSTQEWAIVIENHIKETIDFWGRKSKKTHWFDFRPSLLSVLGGIYIEENYRDRLWDLVKIKTNLNTIMSYHAFLVANYETELLNVYLTAIEEEAKIANNRSHYRDLVKTMKKLFSITPTYKDAIINKAMELKKQYPYRPAMLDELKAIIN